MTAQGLPTPFKHLSLWVLTSWNAHKRRRPGNGLERDGVPVEPNRPNSLSGGAEAPLEFDD